MWSPICFAGRGPDLPFVQSKRIRDNASISKPGQMYKKRPDSNSDDLGHFRCIFYIFFYTIRNRIAGCGKYDPAPFRLPTVRNGHNWPDPVFTGQGRLQLSSLRLYEGQCFFFFFFSVCFWWFLAVKRLCEDEFAVR